MAMKPVAGIAGLALLAGCVTTPGVTQGKPEYSVYHGFGGKSGPKVALNDPHLKPVRTGCGARFNSIYGTELNLYGIYGADFVAALDDMKNCFHRHGFNLAYRQPNGKLTAYPYYDSRLDY